jgi:hypothetical protein
MELIYFILGFISTVTGYGIVLLVKTKSSHISLLEELREDTQIRNEHYKLNSLDNLEIQTKLKKVSENYRIIQKQLETDAYEGNKKLNDRITELTKSFNEQGNKNKRLFDMADEQFTKTQREIQQISNTVKKIVDDPNTLARY